MAYSKARKIVIDPAKVGGSNSTSFPMLFSGTYYWLANTNNGGSVTSQYGFDIGFFADKGLTKPLFWEIETYISTTGAINAWVQVPILSSTTDTVIYLAYGDSSITTFQSDTRRVWDSNYLTVFHLGNGSSLNPFDSTGNASNPSMVNTPTATSGQIDGGGSFVAASSQYIDTGLVTNITGDMTAEAWFTANSLPTFPFIVTNLSAAPRNGYAIMANLTANTMTFQVESGGTISGATANTTTTLGAIYHAVGTYSGSTLTLYINGIAQTTTGSGTMGGSAHNIYIGSLNAEAGRYWDGMIDEVRVSNVARSAAYIKASYNNQFSPSTFYYIFPEVRGS